MPFERKSSTQRGYGYKWQKARETFLAHPDNVLCRYCQADGLTTVATVVDHIIPHKQDLKLFWDRKNWQPLCKPCHDGRKQSEEKGGKGRTRPTIGADGWPV
ncbi:HNH endonuclease [Georhizobium sp. MAB10]|uniref:HNH endonuclease n=1 Tax=Georhizobium sp. MAB10 TaxID=3028319 RepID=UPI003855B0E6